MIYSLKISLFIVFSFLSFTVFSQTKINVGNGPEDIELDTLHGRERLIVSCNDWRKEGHKTGFWQIDIKTNTTKELPFGFDDTSIELHPHGIHLISRGDKDYLFVVNHSSKQQNEILRLRVYDDRLELDSVFRHKLISKPNDVFALSKDVFYWSNANYFNGYVGHYNYGRVEKTLKHLKYPNGLMVEERIHSQNIKVLLKDELIVSTALGNKLYKRKYPYSRKKEKLWKLKGGDNITKDEHGNYLITSHRKMGKFIKHAKDGSKLSPSDVYSYNPKTKELMLIFQNEGDIISGCSTAISYNGKLYLAQVFEPWVVVVSR